ncbi:MAG: hypothetical protein IJY62_00240 [Clostridia bacterium]|nr:hypothetical protein [Clostridia bacterium]
MKKLKLTVLGLMASAIALTATGIHKLSGRADVAETVSMVDIASYVHANSAYTAGYSTEYATYSLKWGDYTDFFRSQRFFAKQRGERL